MEIEENYKKLFFYHWSKYLNSFVILQGFNLMLTKAIFIYWQPYVAFVNILQRRDVWKYVFDLFLNIKALSEMFIDCKCWYYQNCSVGNQNCLWLKLNENDVINIKNDDGLEIFQKMMASWIPLIFLKFKSQKEFDQTDENIPEGRRFDKCCWGEVGCWQQLVESGQLQQRGGELP